MMDNSKNSKNIFQNFRNKIKVNCSDSQAALKANLRLVC